MILTGVICKNVAKKPASSVEKAISDSNVQMSNSYVRAYYLSSLIDQTRIEPRQMNLFMFK